ncbi:MAG: putative baseplate assembly protein, partial [Spirochaetales bacterium]|nr:putative baseplate assembly protein [Spirochaetales bacterium]
KREVPLFVLERHEEPRLFLGFRETFPAEGASVYIRIQGGDSSPAHNNSFGTPLFSETLPSGPRLINLAWEYWNGRLWTSLAVNDYTDYLHESGFIEFMPPPDMHTKKEFGKNLIWLRLRFVSGSFEKKPRITGILTNAVYARNAVSHTRETAGSGTGGPGQSVSPLHGPLLPGIVLCVNEGSIPPAREIENMKAEGIEEPYYAEGENIWVRYTEVPNFYSSGPQSRHFTVDYAEGKIYFGDGWRGMNPPRGKFNIQLASYVTGGGEKGNAAPGTLRILSRSIPFVAGCDNPFPAEGGADRETVDSLKARAAGVFKSLKRAVTAEDFEWLAREASPSVARAFCLAEKNRRGEIRIIVIPRPPSGSPPEEKLTPSRELLRRVRAYLDEHKLVGTKIRVEEPVYRGFSVQLTLTLKSGVLDSQRIKKKITENLRAHFHPLTGADGSGWEFGRAVSSGAVLKQLEKTSGILCVDETSLFDEDAGVIVEKIVLKDDELPFLAETRITDRRSGE